MEDVETKDIKAAPANKMQTADTTKDVADERVEQEYFFPEHGKTVKAFSAEEALAKITKTNNN